MAQTDIGFFASRAIVKKTGDYSGKRAFAVLQNSGLLGGSLLGLIVITVGAWYLSHVVAGVLFTAGAIAIALLLMPYIERRLFSMRVAFAALVTEIIVRERTFGAGATEQAEAHARAQLGDFDGVLTAHNDVQRIARSFFGALDDVSDMLPIDIGPLRRALDWLIRKVAPRIADVCLSYCLAHERKDVPEASKDAVALMAQNPKAILGASIRGHLIERTIGGSVAFVVTVITAVVVFLLIQAVAGGAAADSGVPQEGANVVGAFAAGFGAIFLSLPAGALASWFVRSAFLEPIGLAMLLARFHQVTAGQAVNPQMRERIERAASQRGSSRGLRALLD